MKKILSIALAALMTASAMTACMPTSAEKQLDPAITLASSDALEKAQWLDARLDEIPDDVIIGIGSSETYGIDMSSFEADGYVLRAMGDEVIIFGAAEDGLDRAVRKYAKAAEDNQTENLDETYHEGYRVEKITVAGVDIADYTVTYPDGDTSNVKFAAEEFARLIAKACGAQLTVKPASEAANAAHTVSIIRDESLKELGSRYSIENGNITIAGGNYEGHASASGCLNGVYMFLQQQIGWEDLIYGDSVLMEVESIDIPGDIEVNNDTLADISFLPYTQFAASSVYKNDRDGSYQNYYGRVGVAMHGMIGWTGLVHGQICYADENVYQDILGKVIGNLDIKTAAGQQFYEVDIAQTDAFGYCKCSACLAVYRQEKNSHAGGVIRFANRFSEDVVAAGYPGLAFKVYAYHGSNNPCKTAPNDMVYVTFCTDGHCAVHTIAGGECFGVSFDQCGVIQPGAFNNIDYCAWIEEWCEMSDNIYIWYYALDNNIHQIVTLDQIYYDYAFFYECGVAGVFFQRPCSFLGLSRIELQLAAMMNADPDMTEEEYYAHVDRLLEKEYGEGWEYIDEVINIWEEAEMRNGTCYNCWNYASKKLGSAMDRDYYAGNFDRMVELMETAISLADTEAQEKRAKLLSVSLYYMGIAMQYFEAYDAQDVDRLEYLSDLYDTLIERIYEAREVVCYGMTPANIIGVDGHITSIYEDITTEAWTAWVEERESLNPHSENPLPAPEDFVPPETST